jgi:hypothetical protein
MILEVFDQRVESRVFGNDVQVGIRISGSQSPDIVSDVKVEGIGAVPIHLDVFHIKAEVLERTHHLQWDLTLPGAQKHHDLERAAAQQANVPGLDILEVHQYEVRSDHVLERAGAGQSL